ncbi:MAG: GAF domain-containing protein [Chloroflexi bacterium]|nr:GAF domain-containing protein [Chloroflexota bacterium]
MSISDRLHHPRPDDDRWTVLLGSELRFGSALRLFFLVLGLAVSWVYFGEGGLRIILPRGMAMYAVLSLAWLVLLGMHNVPHSLGRLALLGIYAMDIAFVSYLILRLGGVASDLYLLYVLLAIKAAVYYPFLPTVILLLFTIPPVYVAALYGASQGLYFLLDWSFLLRYGLLGVVIVLSTYAGWLMEFRQRRITELYSDVDQKTRDLAQKTGVMARTARELGDRVLQLRSLQEGIKAINAALRLEDVLRLIAANASQVLGGIECSVALLDDSEQKLVILATTAQADGQFRQSTFRQGEGVAGWVVSHGQAVLINDCAADPRYVRRGTAPSASIMSVPLMVEGQAIGALNATSAAKGAFTSDNLALLGSFADQAAVAVKNARLYRRLAQEKQRTEENLQQIMALNDVARALVSTLQLETTLRLIVERLMSLVEVKACAVALLEEDDGAPVLVGRVGRGVPPETVREMRLASADDPALAQALTSRQPQLVEDLTKSRVPFQRQLAERWGMQSYMVTPLVARDRVIGVLYLADRAPRFGAARPQLMDSFSYLAATAIENAQLYRDVWERRNELEAVLQGIGDGVVVTDARHRVELINPVARHIFDLEEAPQASAGVSAAAVEPQLHALLQEALGQKDALVREIGRPGSREGDERIYQALAAPRVDADGLARGAVTVLRDITAQKELERMKSNFLSVVSHELKTPLHSIKGFVDIILMGKTGPLSETQRDFLQTVRQQTGQLQNLINDLLEFSRLEAGQVRLRLEEVSLAELSLAVAEKLEPLANQGDVTLRNEIPPTLSMVRGDAMRLEQVLTNLVDNAIKFTPKGGQVRLEGRDLGQEVQVWVHDTGIGIPPEEGERVFDRFYQVDGGSTRSYRGTGLGLTICKHIVERHQGRIWVEPRTGPGATFTFVLPKELELEEEEAALDFTTPARRPRQR